MVEHFIFMSKLSIIFTIVITSYVNINEIAGQEQCITPNGEQALCLPLDCCPTLHDGVTSLNYTVIEFARKSTCKYFGNYQYVCCGTLNYLLVESCVTPNQEQGKCLKLEECPALLKGVLALNNTSVEFAQQSLCKTDGDVRYVCCGDLAFLITTIEQARPERSTQLSSLPSSTSTPIATTVVVIEARRNGSKKNRPLVSDRTYCGFQHTDDRFYNSNDTAIDEFPWNALLIHTNDTGNKQQPCLGVLISTRYVVTTAFCVNVTDADQGFKITSVQLGEYNTNATNDCVSYSDYDECAEPVINVGVEKTIIHPNFNVDREGLRYNIALIRLSARIAFSDYVRPICLPTADVKAKIGSRLISSGWGTTVWEENLEKKSKFKKRGFGIVVPSQTCIESSEIDLEGAVTEEYQICFRQGANGSCLDDSSAPLMQKVNLQWQLEGIMSFPIAQQCGEGSYFIYTNITKFIDWIVDNVQP